MRNSWSGTGTLGIDSQQRAAEIGRGVRNSLGDELTWTNRKLEKRPGDRTGTRALLPLFLDRSIEELLLPKAYIEKVEKEEKSTRLGKSLVRRYILVHELRTTKSSTRTDCVHVDTCE